MEINRFKNIKKTKNARQGTLGRAWPPPRTSRSPPYRSRHSLSGRR